MNGIKNRGFASLTKERRKEIAAKGGRASAAKGVSHRFSHDEAVAAGKKGRKKSYGTIINNL